MILAKNYETACKFVKVMPRILVTIDKKVYLR